MPPRFHAPDLQPDSVSVALPQAEGEHLARVLRLGVGDVVHVFDGRGCERRARVASIGRGGVSVDALEPVEPAPEPRVRVTLVQAVLKGDKMDDLLRDAAMLGVRSIQPLLTANTDLPASAFSGSHRLDRWGRIVVSSVKQCGRAVVPDLALPLTLSEYLARPCAGTRLMLVEPVANPAGELTSDETLRQSGAGGDVHVLIGPEGGWSPEELALARQQGCALVTFGRRTLRADAAPLVVLSVLQHVWGDL